MRLAELFRLVWINLAQNKFKVILTSIGIVVGSATIMLVIAIGTGGKMDVADQFKNLNAGAIDISYGTEEESLETELPMGEVTGEMGSFTPPDMTSMRESRSGQMPGGFGGFQRLEEDDDSILLTQVNMDDLKTFVPGVSDATISYSTTADVEGGNLEDTTSYTIAGTLSNYGSISNLSLSIGEYLTEEEIDSKEKVCVLGYDVAIEIFGSSYEAYDEVIYIDSRPYIVTGILQQMGTVASGISPDTSIFIPYETGIKYITGNSITPTITLISEDINEIETVKSNAEAVLLETYPNGTFILSDAGSKMEAAASSNETLTLLLYSMAAIVFVVGGIGIMNVLFVSVKERTNEIGILKAMGCSRKDILMEFLFEAACMSFVGSVIGVLFALGITPIIESFSVRVELSFVAGIISLTFGVVTGCIFGFYPAFKASRLVPVIALNQE